MDQREVFSGCSDYPVFFFSFLFCINLFYLFIFGCIGSSLLHAGFL